MKCREHGKFDLCDHFEPFPQGTPSLLVLFRGWLVNKKKRTKKNFMQMNFKADFQLERETVFFLLPLQAGSD